MTMKKAAKKGVEKAVTAAATKTGEHVGKKAGDKIVQMLGGVPHKNPPAKKVTFKSTPNGWYPQNTPTKKRKMTQQEINQRLNAILSAN